MADNVLYTPGVGASIAADDVGGVLSQRVKVQTGVDGVANDVSAANPMPVIAQDAAGNQLVMDAFGRLLADLSSGCFERVKTRGNVRGRGPA